MSEMQSEDNLTRIRLTLRKFYDYANDLMRSRHHNFNDNLRIFVEFCEKGEFMKDITSELKSNPNVDLDKWWKDFQSTGGSMVGSKRYALPINDEDRTALLYQFLLKINSGKISFDNFGMDAFGSLNLDHMVYEFNDAITEKLVRLLSYRLENLERTVKEELLPKEPQILKDIPLVSSGSLSFIEQTLASHGWNEALRELTRAGQAFNDGRMPDCCHNLRKGLEIIWMKVYEKLEGSAIPMRKGRKQDIGVLIDALRKRKVPDDLTGLVSRIWAYITQRDHIEVKGGQAPPELEVYFGLELVFSAVDYLLRLLP